MSTESEHSKSKDLRSTANEESADGSVDTDLTQEHESVVEELLVDEDTDVTPQLSVVMPTLNEEKGIRECIDRIKSAVKELGISTEIIISDSSTDRTPEIAQRNGATVVYPDEDGYGNAYKYGFERARGEYIAIGDADTTYDFEELPKLLSLAEREDADLVLGSRLEGEIKPGAMPPLHQYIGNPLLTKFLNVFYDAGVSDAHSGFRVIHSQALEKLELQTEGMEFASEMIMDAAAKDMTIEEVPITYHEREGDATLESFRDGWRHVKFMLVNAPGYLFSIPAGVFTMIGLLTMSLSLTNLSIGWLTFGIHTMIGGMLMTIVGYQVGTLALFSSIAANPIREPRDQFTQIVRDKFRLEHGASLGACFGGIGLLALSYVLVQWVVQGTVVLGASWNLAAATLVVLGFQTVFSSFFFSLLSERRATDAGTG